MSIRWRLHLTLVAFLTASALGHVASGSADGGVSALPEELRRYLNTNLPDWEILGTDASTPEIARFVASTGHHQFSPFGCSGDFNADGLEDAALLLRDKHTGTLKLIAFHQTPSRRYVQFLLEDLRGIIVQPHDGIDLYVICEKPGLFLDIEKDRHVRVKADAITRGFFGKASRLFYFEAGKYKQIPTSD